MWLTVTLLVSILMSRKGSKNVSFTVAIFISHNTLFEYKLMAQCGGTIIFSEHIKYIIKDSLQTVTSLLLSGLKS